jgi:hypothetical protein
MTSKAKHPVNPTLDRLRREIRTRREDPDIHYRLAAVIMDPSQLNHPIKKNRIRARQLLSRAID